MILWKVSQYNTACSMVSEINLLYHREIVPLSNYYLKTNIYASTIFFSTSSTLAGLSKRSNLNAQIIGIRLRLCCLMTQVTSCFYKHQIMVDYIWLIQIMKKIIFWKLTSNTSMLHKLELIAPKISPTI